MQVVAYLTALVMAVLLQGKMKYAWSPDLILVLVIVLSVKRSKSVSITGSFFSGFLQDAAISFGFVNTLVKTCCSALVLLVRDHLSIEKRTMCPILVLLLTPVAFAIASFAARTQMAFVPVLVSSVLNALISPFLYSALDRFIPDEK